MADRTMPLPARQAISWMTVGRRTFPVVLFALALVPRLVALERYITPDELIWVYRSLQFREAILDGRLAGTLVAGHPGVITTWLGAVALSLQVLFSPAQQESYRWLAQLPFLMPDNVAAYVRLAEFLSLSRLLVALVNSLGIVLTYFLVRRVWGMTAAAIGSLFLALDPFLAGLSGLLHVDGLSATFATLSLVMFAVAYQPSTDRRLRWLIGSGVAAGLAALTKSPTLVLLPVLGLALIIAWGRRDDLGPGQRLRGILLDGVVFGLAAIGVTWLLLPALWVSPASVVSTVFGSANRHLDEALRETFFLGRVAYNHGPIFYPVVLLWRLSPVVWLSLIPLFMLIMEMKKTGRWPATKGAGLVWLLLLWSAVFLVAITPAAKKFDRYILPVVPAILLLAGYIWATWGERHRRPAAWVLPGIVAVQAVYWLVFAVYPLTAYNPLIGGPRTAVQVLPVGWGEGIGASGRWLAQNQEQAVNQTAIAGVAPALAPFFPGRTLVAGIDDPLSADYLIITAGGRQLDPAGVETQTRDLELIETLRFGGLDQAWVYRRATPRPLPSPSDLPQPVVFAERMALTAVEQKVADDTLFLSTRWQRLGPMGPDDRFSVRLTVVDEAGNIWATSENDLLNEVYFYPHNWERDPTDPVRYSLELNPAMPPGRYQLRLSLIDRQTSGQLPVRIGGDGFRGVGYEIGEFDLPLSDAIVSASRVEIAQPSSAKWLKDSLWLLGTGLIPAETLAGSDVPVEMIWHAPAGRLPAGIELDWSLVAADDQQNIPLMTTALSRFDSGHWRVGETIHERYRLPIPPGIAAGRYSLAVQPVLGGGTPVEPAAPLAEMTINNIERLYTLPTAIDVPLDTCFGESICLRGVDLSPIAARPGEPVQLTLYWQALDEPDTVYTAFTHVLNDAGEIVLQADQWPGGLPSDVWAAGQVITDPVSFVLPAELNPGTYALNVGLYHAEDGQRLPISSGLGTGDYLRLPIQIVVTSP